MIALPEIAVVDSHALIWYASGQVRGLVSDGGPQAGIILTDWSMVPSGRGNHIGATTGATPKSNAMIASATLLQAALPPHFRMYCQIIPQG